MADDRTCDVRVIQRDLGEVSAGWLVYRPFPPETNSDEVVVVVDPECEVDVDAVLRRLSDCLSEGCRIQRHQKT